MFIRLPVSCNVGLAVKQPMEDARMSSTPPTGPPPIPKAWQHPGFSLDPRRMIAAVARARALVNRQTASSACQEPLDASETLSVLSHVSRLASKWNLVGYTLDTSQIETEIASRGPVVAAVPVRDSLLAHISARLNGEEPVYRPDDPELGLVSVAILGWKDEHWIAALPWGKFTSATSAHAWDGCVRIPKDMCVNACAMCKRAQLGQGTFAVKVMPASWDPPTTKPLPPSNESSRTSGKVKHLKKPKVSKMAFTDENVTLVLKCVVTATIMVLAILVLVMMKTRRH
jgi:hypothetical protein